MKDDNSSNTSWCQRNWCWGVRVCLAIIGILVPLIMFLLPCQDETMITYEMVKQPVDLYVMLDASQSMQQQDSGESRWKTSIKAALNLTETFERVGPKEITLGAGMFATRRRNAVEITKNITAAEEIIASLAEDFNPAQDGSRAKWGNIGGVTSYYQALRQFLEDWEARRNPSAKPILLFISDGDPYNPSAFNNGFQDWELARDLSRGIRGKPTDYKAIQMGDLSNVGDSQNNMWPAGVDAFIDDLKNSTQMHAGGEVLVMGILINKDTKVDVCDDRQADELAGAPVECLFQISSCDGQVSYKKWQKEYYKNENNGKESNSICDFYLHFKDVDAFMESSQAIAESIQNVVGDITREKVETSCVKGPWLIFLLLLLPLLCLSCFPLLYNMKKTYVVKKKKSLESAVVLTPPPPPAAAMKPVANKGNGFKWQIKAHDQYLWNLGGGATPMKVDYGGKAPPSAPLDPSLERVRRSVNEWEDADGYVNVEVEEDRTLEQFTSDQVKHVGGFFARCCPCCPCCRPKPNNDVKQTKMELQEMSV